MAAPLVGARVAAVNPTFVFGADGARSVADEVDRPFRATFGDYLAPLLTNADVVAHATTAAFDPVRSLSANAGLVGPLRWDVGLPSAPGWVAEPGPPWALVAMPAIPMPGDEDIAVAAVATLSERPVRTLVVLRGRSAGVLGTLPPNTVVVPDLPRDEALTHAAICVCPASHGTVMSALRHGVPLVVVPWAADQPGVAWRVSRAGGGVSVVPDGDVAGSVKDAVERVLHDPRYAAGADGGGRGRSPRHPSR